MIKCMLCDEEFGAMTYTHLESVHGVTMDDYRRMFPDAELRIVSDETLQKMREVSLGNHYGLGNRGSTGYEHTKEALQKMREAALGNKHSLGWTHVHTEEVGQKIRESMQGNQNALGHVLSGEARKSIGKTKLGNKYSLGHVHTEEAKQLMREAALGNQNFLGHRVSEDSKRRNSESNKSLWKDPEYAKWMSEKWSRKPNGPECQLQSVLDRYFPNEWKYTGDGKDAEDWIEGVNPDFMSANGRKHLIEVFGYHWHDSEYFPNRMSEEELIAHYKSYGYDCIVFWEFDVYNEEEVVECIRRTFGGVK